MGALNVGGQELYRSLGYDVVSEGLTLAGPLRQILMRRRLQPATKAVFLRQGDPSSDPMSNSTALLDVLPGGAKDVGATHNNGGVYVWHGNRVSSRSDSITDAGSTASADL